MAQTRRIKVTGVKRHELSTEDLAYIYYLMGKASLREKRERAAKEKAKHRERKQ